MPRKKKPKPGDLRAAMEIPEVEEAIKARLPVLIQHMFDLAEGVVWVEQRVDDDGNIVPRIYQAQPDRQALQFLIENVIGKTPQRVEMTGKDGGPMEVIPWAPVSGLEAAGLLTDGQDVVDGVVTFKEEVSDGA